MNEATTSACICGALRKATRAVTKRYDKHLKPSGLRITQYSMLANINRNPGITVTELAKIMVMDQTTVTRNLQLLKKLGYIETRESEEDQRVKTIEVSKLGKEKFETARPYWHEAQQEVERDVGKLGFDLMLQSLNSIVQQ